MNTKPQPLVKWAGGKVRELKYILPNIPKYFDCYFEPFVGGGAVFTAIQAKAYYINDKSSELIDLYKIIVSEHRERFFEGLNEILHNWVSLEKNFNQYSSLFLKNYTDFSKNKISKALCFTRNKNAVLQLGEELKKSFSTSYFFHFYLLTNDIIRNVNRKMVRMKVLEIEKGALSEKDIDDNMEAALKSGFYSLLRHIYNYRKNYKIGNPLATALFYFIRNYAFSGMFRYNAKGEFNVPYGGIAYNQMDIRKKIAYLKSESLKKRLIRTTLVNADFQDFFTQYPPTKNDFVFLDPPYDSNFSTYAQNEFGKTDQQRLADYLFHQCNAQWMMVIKKTDFIEKLYTKPHINIRCFDSTYLVNFKNRNAKNTQHLLITNY